MIIIIEDTKKLKVPKKEIMDLLKFRMRLAEELIYMGKTVTPPTKKKGRPPNTPSPTVKKKLYSENQKLKHIDSRPSTSIQLDKVSHLPNHNTRKEATRCKNTGFDVAKNQLIDFRGDCKCQHLINEAKSFAKDQNLTERNLKEVRLLKSSKQLPEDAFDHLANWIHGINLHNCVQDCVFNN
ncbi:hypothetical protein QTP88_022739 [Uroleucon formosanum]